MSQVSEIKVIWTPNYSTRVVSIHIQSRIVGTSEWSEVASALDPTLGETTFQSNAPDTDVEVRARYRMVSGLFGEWFTDHIVTAPVTVAYVDLTGTPSKLGDINPTEGGKLTGIEPGATVGGIIGGPSANVRNPDGTLYVPPTAAQLVDTTPPATPTSLTLSSTLTGDATAILRASWTAPGDSDLAGYDIGLREGSGGYIESTTTSTSFERTVPRGTSFTGRVRAWDRAGNRSGWTAEVTHTSAADTVAPGAITILKAEATFNSVFVTFQAPADADVATVRIDLATTGYVLIESANVSVAPGSVGKVVFNGLSRATSYVTGGYAYDTSGNQSPGCPASPFTTSGGISAGDFTTGLSATQTVASLPNPAGYTGASSVFNQADGKLYTLNGGAWIASTVIDDNSIGSAKLVDSSVTSTKLADAAVVTSKINAGAITETKIGDDAISTRTIAAYAITANELAANSVYADAVVSQAITTAKLDALAVTAEKIAVNAVTADKIAANSVTANKIVAGTITAAQIATGALTASVLAVGNTDSILPDSEFRDSSWWNGTTASSGSYPAAQVFATDGAWNKFPRAFRIQPGTFAFFTPFFAVDPGASYKLRVQTYIGNITGWFNPTLHIPYVMWYSLKDGAGYTNGNPSVQGPNSYTTTNYFGGAVASFETVIDNLSGWNVRQMQFRFDGAFSGDVVEIALSLVRISDATLIKDGAITTDKITVGTLNGDRIQTDTLDANKIKANTVLAGSVTVDGSALSTIKTNAATGASDPVGRINSGITQIDPGKIVISGGTSLADWRQGGDVTKIAGGSISANTIAANKLTIGNRGIGFIGLNFEWNPLNNWVSWTEGIIYYTDSAGNPTQQYVNPGNTNGAGAHQFFYWTPDMSTIGYTQANIDTGNQVMIGSWWGSSNLNINYGGTIINGDRITTGTIDANRIKANTVLASSVTVEGSALSTIASNAATGAGDPATRINGGSTQISPGKIVISGSTTLSDWRSSSDTTKIEGGNIAANTISANKLRVGQRGINTQGIDFQYSPGDGRLYWTGGQVLYVDDYGNPTYATVAGASIPWLGGTFNFIYWNKGSGAFDVGVDNWGAILATDGVIMCEWRNGPNFSVTYGGTVIDGNRITTGSIEAQQIKAGTITANKIVLNGITTDRIAPSAVQQVAFQTLSYTISVPRGGGYTVPGGNGGGGGACPTSDEQILMANATNDGPGYTKNAGAVAVGDIVWTQHEHTLEWGAFEVVAATIVTSTDVWSAYGFKATGLHRTWQDGAWTFHKDAGERLAGSFEVVKLTVANAHTYVCAGVLSHNIKPVEPTEPYA